MLIAGKDNRLFVGTWAYLECWNSCAVGSAMLMNIERSERDARGFDVRLYSVDGDELHVACESEVRSFVKGEPFIVCRVKQNRDSLKFNARFPGYWAVIKHSFCSSMNSSDELIDAFTCPDRYSKVSDVRACGEGYPICGVWKYYERDCISNIIKISMRRDRQPTVAVRLVDAWETGFVSAKVLSFERNEIVFELYGGWIECRLKLRTNGGATCYWTRYGNVWRKCNVMVSE